MTDISQACPFSNTVSTVSCVEAKQHIKFAAFLSNLTATKLSCWDMEKWICNSSVHWLLVKFWSARDTTCSPRHWVTSKGKYKIKHTWML